jgi:hypothetical protein
MLFLSLIISSMLASATHATLDTNLPKKISKKNRSRVNKTGSSSDNQKKKARNKEALLEEKTLENQENLSQNYSQKETASSSNESSLGWLTNSIFTPTGQSLLNKFSVLDDLIPGQMSGQKLIQLAQMEVVDKFLPFSTQRNYLRLTGNPIEVAQEIKDYIYDESPNKNILDLWQKPKLQNFLIHNLGILTARSVLQASPIGFFKNVTYGEGLKAYRYLMELSKHSNIENI